jgi:alkylation response protein AidB-like acyl-CoA dehydrogenase
MNFAESDERVALRAAVRELAGGYGSEYYQGLVRTGGKVDELWAKAGRLGYLGVHLPEEYGGGGAGIGELAAVCEEFAAAGCPLLLMVVSPAICGTVIARFGTDDQRKRWLPGFADGTLKMAFGITEPDAGSNSHRLSTIARRDEPGKDGSDWLLTGRKTFISAVDEASAVLIVGRTADERTGKLKPVLFVVPTDAPGFEATGIDMEVSSPEKQWQLFLDDVRLPADALVGSENAGLAQLFAGLNPERIMVAAYAAGIARQALAKAVSYAKVRQVWDVPIGAHQGLAHPLAAAHVQVELSRLMLAKAAWHYDTGDDAGAGEAANMAKYAAAEACCAAVDQAVQTLGGNGLTTEYGVAQLLVASRLGRVAPVSREMILNFIAQHSLGLPRSY